MPCLDPASQQFSCARVKVLARGLSLKQPAAALLNCKRRVLLGPKVRLGTCVAQHPGSLDAMHTPTSHNPKVGTIISKGRKLHSYCAYSRITSSVQTLFHTCCMWVQGAHAHTVRKHSHMMFLLLAAGCCRMARKSLPVAPQPWFTGISSF